MYGIPCIQEHYSLYGAFFCGNPHLQISFQAPAFHFIQLPGHVLRKKNCWKYLVCNTGIMRGGFHCLSPNSLILYNQFSRPLHKIQGFFFVPGCITAMRLLLRRTLVRLDWEGSENTNRRAGEKQRHLLRFLSASPPLRLMAV